MSCNMRKSRCAADQADFAADFMQRSATYMMAVAVKDALKAIFGDPKRSKDSSIKASFEVARLVRNAFAHAPFAPAWSIDPDCRDQVFEVPTVVRLDTTGLQGLPFHWKHYGGPLALLSLCRFVRIDLLEDNLSPRKIVPLPNSAIRQIGDLLLVKVDKIPDSAVPVEVQANPDGSVPLGGGYSVLAASRTSDD